MEKISEEKDVVIPGEPLSKGMDFLPGDGTYREDKKILSNYLGVVQFKDRLVKVVPIRGRYIPEKDDIVIGEIERVSHSNWTIEINSPYTGILSISEATEEYVDLNEDDISDYFDIGELVATKITKVTKSKDVQLSMEDKMCKKLEGGRIVEIPHTKVPRLIGKKGSMINTIKRKTSCTIIVGQNGRIWLEGDNEELAAKAIKKVDREAHTEGLTEKISEWLDERRGDE